MRRSANDPIGRGSTINVPASARFLSERKWEHSSHAVIFDGVINLSTIHLHTRFRRSISRLSKCDVEL